MKYLSILFALFLTAGITNSAIAQEDAISKYFSKYVDDERFTVVYISGKMFSMINKMELDLDDEEAQAVMSVVKDLKGLRILTTETDGAKFYKEALATINTKGYETLLEVREGKETNVKFLVKDSDSGSMLNELLLLVGGEDEEFVLLSFIGNIDLSQVGKLSKAFDDKGDKGNK
jgi:vacuolar-type H+-ATPase subunit F/Vma7